MHPSPRLPTEKDPVLPPLILASMYNVGPHLLSFCVVYRRRGAIQRTPTCGKQIDASNGMIHDLSDICSLQNAPNLSKHMVALVFSDQMLPFILRCIVLLQLNVGHSRLAVILTTFSVVLKRPDQFQLFLIEICNTALRNLLMNALSLPIVIRTPASVVTIVTAFLQQNVSQTFW